MSRRENDPDDLPVEKLRNNSSSVSKDWLIAILTSLVGALLAIGMHNLDAQQAKTNILVLDHSVRIERLEENKIDIARRLDGIEQKLDKILGWNSERISSNEARLAKLEQTR